MRLTILVCRSVFSTTLFIIGWIMAVLGYTPPGNGQSLILSVKDPENAQVCQLSFTALQIRNTQSTSLQNLRVQLRLPDGIEYLPGSLINAGEFNITRLSEPWFQIDEIAPGDSLHLSIQCRFRCALYEQINQGASFSNTWIVHSMLGMDSIRSAQPYVVQTPFLLIQNVTDSTAVLGASFQRTIRITNTRLGSLSRFTFEDRHDELEIHSNSGTRIQQTGQLLQLEFGPADFLQIGDRDSLFERDESVVITESIRHLSCLVEQVRSDFAAYWGCDGDQCQRYEEHATLNFIQPNQFAKLQFVSNTRYPECICSDQGAGQELIIRNTGGQTAENIVITLKTAIRLSPFIPYGILRNSIRLEGAGAILDTLFDHQLTLPTCKSPDGHAGVIIKLTEIPAGTEVRLHFNYMTCLACPPSNEKLPWYFSYAYSSKCIPSSEVSGMDLVAEIINPMKAIQAQIGMTTTNGAIEDQQTYTIENILNFNQPVSNQVLILEYDLPCPLRLTDTTFLLNGKAPSFRQITGDSSKHVYLEYAPPFPANLTHRFPVFVDCTYLCDQNGNETYETHFLSSCPDSFHLPVSLPVKICMGAQLSCPNREFDCGPCRGGEFLFEVKCSSIQTRKDTVHSYWFGSAETYRHNYGFSDPDDNRLSDSGPLDTSTAQIRRFITGDTVVHDFKLTLVSDLQDIEADSIVLIVNSDLSYDTLITEIEILDRSQNIRYSCLYLVSTKHSEPKPIPNCIAPVVTRSGFGPGIRIEFTPEMLNRFGAGIPPGFRFEPGDQIKARMLARISSYVGGRIYKGVVTHRAFFINRKQVRLDPYSCLAEKDSIELASYGIQFDQSFNEILICHTTFDLFKCTFKGTRELANFFNREIRPMGQLDSLRILIDNDQLVIDSFQFRFYFDSSSNRKAIDSFWFP
ncbi:MAG TPA: hypothetical protein VFX48_07720, partial [Saprospiraceae bacterium]|nr:hypothetical protein [Saprospiraceae bacterium]